MPEKVSDEGIGLPELLESLRYDLDEAQTRLAGKGKKAILELEGAEIEVAITAKKSTSAKGGVKISVLSWIGIEGGVGRDTSRETGNKIRLKLKPTNGLKIGAARRG